nr:hypothetical protein [Tanacetum cinerariifolium]
MAAISNVPHLVDKKGGSYSVVAPHGPSKVKTTKGDDKHESQWTSEERRVSGVEDLIPILSESEGIPEHVCDVPSHDNSQPLDVSKDQIEDFSESNKEFSLIDDDSFSIDDIDYVEASPPDPELVSSEVTEIVIPEVGGIDDDILLMIEHDDLREKLRNVNLLISKIEALNANPTPSFDCKTKSSSTSLNTLLEETNTFDNSLPKFKTFCFDVEEISSSSTTTHPDISLPEYEAFYDDHVKEISIGSPTTPFDISLSEYDSFIFDLLINPFPPAGRSDSYEFIDELIPFISAPEYDCFLFKDEPNSKDFTKDVVENISPTKEPQVLTTLPTHPTLQLNLKFQPSSESLFAYVVWIFLPFLVYSVSLEAAEIVILEVKEIEDNNLREKLLNVHLLFANIEALKDNPTPSSEPLTKSSSTSLNSLLEETSTFHNSLPEFENFYFDLGEISSGNTTTHFDISLPDYKAFSFNNDHIKEISSGSPTTQTDISRSEYDSFIFDLTHEEFVDELAHIISPPEYDCFYFRDFPDPGELMSALNFGIRKNLSTTLVNLPIEDDYSPLLAYVV